MIHCASRVDDKVFIGMFYIYNNVLLLGVVGCFRSGLTQYRFTSSHRLSRIVTRTLFYQIKWAPVRTAHLVYCRQPIRASSGPISLLGPVPGPPKWYLSVTFGLFSFPEKEYKVTLRCLPGGPSDFSQ